jgi:hypothetical protein
MLRAGSLRRLSAGLVLVAAVAVGTGGCLLAPFPEPVAYGPSVIVAPRPVIIAPRPHPYYHGGYYGGYYRGGHRRSW